MDLEYKNLSHCVQIHTKKPISEYQMPCNGLNEGQHNYDAFLTLKQ
jgi:hypothetical protein